MREELERLSNRVWKTYKIRVNTAERFKSTHAFLSFISIYYSAILTGVSVLNYKNNSEIMEIFSIVLSSIVTLLFVFFEGKSYNERHKKMKENYNNIYLLYYKIMDVLKTNNGEINGEIFETISKEYVALLNDVENQLDIDYLTYKRTDSQEKCTFSECIKYYTYQVFAKYGLRLVIFAIPTIFLIISILQLFNIMCF